MKFFQRFWSILGTDRWAKFSLFILIVWILIALIPQFFSDVRDIPMVLSQRLAKPSSVNWLGVDSNGQSVFRLIINGARTSFIVSLGTVLLSVCIGVPLGALAGYQGGVVDVVVSRVVDILLAFPPLILPIAITAFFGSGLSHVLLALSLTGWVSYARLVRSQFLTLKQRDYVLAARSLGANQGRLMFRHILPNAFSPLVVQATFSLAGAIISEAGLSFLGLGVSQSHVSWGTMLNEATSHLVDAPFLAIVPACALFSVVTSLNFVGEALRLALDPKSKPNLI